MKKRTTIVLLILALSIYASNIKVQSAVKENDHRPTPLELTSHDPVYIISDNGFEVFPGTGSAKDPYVIDGYNIKITKRSGIHIIDTTKYFVIRNCCIDGGLNGIYIKNVADGTAIVINNTCSNNFQGILIGYSSSSTVINNMCSNNGYGIRLDYSGNSTVASNTCSNDYWGIYLQSSGSSTVTSNTFTNCGLYISESTVDAYISYAFENNWVNGKKLGFYTNLDSTTIAQPVYGQLILVNCTNVTVSDQILNNSTIGLFLFSCTYSVIINNTCSNNNKHGIRIYSSSSSTVANNTCNNNWHGILLDASGSSTVANNTCNNNDYGIRIYSSSSSMITNNMCKNNNIYGITIFSSDFCVVTYNLLQENEEYGIYLRFGSNNNLIHHNNFVDNNLGGSSQACNDGTNNTWFDTATKEGNYWSDWSRTGNYYIDGLAISFDKYPFDEPVASTTDEIPLDFTFTLLIILVPLILARIISRRRNKLAVRNYE